MPIPALDYDLIFNSLWFRGLVILVVVIVAGLLLAYIMRNGDGE